MRKLTPEERSERERSQRAKRNERFRNKDQSLKRVQVYVEGYLARWVLRIADALRLTVQELIHDLLRSYCSRAGGVRSLPASPRWSLPEDPRGLERVDLLLTAEEIQVLHRGKKRIPSLSRGSVIEIILMESIRFRGKWAWFTHPDTGHEVPLFGRVEDPKYGSYINGLVQQPEEARWYDRYTARSIRSKVAQASSPSAFREALRAFSITHAPYVQEMYFGGFTPPEPPPPSTHKAIRSWVEDGEGRPPSSRHGSTPLSPEEDEDAA